MLVPVLIKKVTKHVWNHGRVSSRRTERTSQRTKDALAELKRKGKKLGSPQNLNASARNNGLEARQKNAIKDKSNRRAAALIIALKSNGSTFYKITKELNNLGFKTRRGNNIMAEAYNEQEKSNILWLINPVYC